MMIDISKESTHYVSPLDVILEKSDEFKWHHINSEFQKYSGSLDKVLTQLDSLPSINSSIAEMNFRELITLALNPTRVIRGVLEYKLGNSTIKETPSIVNAASKLALRCYLEPARIKSHILEFKETLGPTRVSSLLKRTIIQSNDETTWEASDPEYSSKTSKEISFLVHNKDILFIPLAQGGILSGIDSYLRYLVLSKSTNSDFYPVRFSSSKSDDKRPRLYDDEIEYLRKTGRDKQVVLFDEDSYTGNTMGVALEYFKSEVFPRKRVHTFINMDMRQ